MDNAFATNFEELIRKMYRNGPAPDTEQLHDLKTVYLAGATTALELSSLGGSSILEEIEAELTELQNRQPITKSE